METLRPIVWMVAGCLASWAVVLVFHGPAEEAFFGMLGPLIAVCVTWWLVVRSYRADPMRVGSLLMSTFAAKMLFFGVYVVLAMRGWDLQSIPFMTSFAVYFVALYVVQATLIRGLTAPRAS